MCFNLQSGVYNKSIYSLQVNCGCEMTVLKSCCGCCSLRRGCIAIVLFSLFVYICDWAIKGPSLFHVFGIPLSAVLLVGAIWRHRQCLWSCIVGNFIFNVLVCVAVISNLLEVSVKMKAHDIQSKRVDIETLYCIYVVVLLIIIIMWVLLVTGVVYSYICELRQVAKGKNINADGNNATPEANNLVPMSLLSVQFENKSDGMINSM